MESIRWNVGKIKITSLIETDAGSIVQGIIPKATFESIKEIKWLTPFFADENGKLKAVVQSFIIEAEGKLIVVDTCVGNNKPRIEIKDWNMLQSDFMIRFEKLGFKADEIDYVLCTHLHFDHVGWNTRLEDNKWVPTFPNAKYLFAKNEYDYWKEAPEKEIEDDHSGFRDSILPIIHSKLEQLIPTDYIIVDGVRIIETPGHTPSHVSVVIESNGESAIITGDAIHHPCQIAEPTWETLSDTFPEKLKKREFICLPVRHRHRRLFGGGGSLL